MIDLRSHEIDGPVLRHEDMKWHASCRSCPWVADSCSQREVVAQAVDAHRETVA